MKRALITLTALLPAFYLLTIGLCLLINPEDETLFFLLGVYILIGLLLPCLLGFFTRDADTKLLALGNIWMAAGNVTLLMAEIIYWVVLFHQNRIAEENGAWGGGLGLVLILILYLPHWISYFFTHIAMSINCNSALRGICSKSVKAAHVILHLLPASDLISAIWVYRCVKKHSTP